MCNKKENNPKKLAKDVYRSSDAMLDDKKNNLSIFNIMDIPIDIVHDNLLESRDPATADMTLAEKINHAGDFGILDDKINKAVSSIQLPDSTCTNSTQLIPDPTLFVAPVNPSASTKNDDSDYNPTEDANESDESLSLVKSPDGTPEQINKNNKQNKREISVKKRKFGINKKKINQELRMKGKQYVGYRRPANQNKTFQDINRENRKLGPTCSSTHCAKSKNRKCREIHQEVRKELFTKFWDELSWEQRNTFVCNQVTKENIKKRKSAENIGSRRSGTLKYTIKVDEENIPVCKKMFLSTFGLNEAQVSNWVNRSKHGISERQTERAKEGGIISTRIPTVFMKNFLDNLNKLPSHYCRKDTNKMYLEQSFSTITELYQIYVSTCKESNEISMSQSSLTKMLKKMNISLYVPKKDKCDICCQYKEKNLSEEEWHTHQKEQDRSREEKEKDKEESLKCVHHVLTMDMQAVKVCPSIMASSVYFKTKLCVHNFTVYNLATKHCTCYWFDETQGDLQASTFASFIVDYIRRHLNDGKPIIIYSDSCTYQSRNSVMSNALLYLSKELNVTIQQKFLVKGHTQMECDSVHATIEKKLSNKKIVLPSDYARITEDARSLPDKYEVKMVNYKFFTNFNNPLVYSSIRPGRNSKDPTVLHLRSLKYSPEGTIFYKLHFDDEYKQLPQEVRKTVVPTKTIFRELHKERLKIKKTKFDHLQLLKPLLPEDCWLFYDNLPHD